MTKVDMSVVGKTFGRWFVDSFANTSKTNAYFNCICSCGTNKRVLGSSLKSGDSLSCGCYLKDFNKIRPTLSGDKRLDIYNNYKSGAKRRGYSFDISKEDFFRIVQEPCIYCGEQGTKQSKRGVQKDVFRYTGIDRLDNTVGYTLENSVPCCRLCNSLKSNIHISTFLNKVKDIYEYSILPRSDVVKQEDRENASNNILKEHMSKYMPTS